MKKFWALLLAALLVVSILPVSALAADVPEPTPAFEQGTLTINVAFNGLPEDKIPESVKWGLKKDGAHVQDVVITAAEKWSCSANPRRLRIRISISHSRLPMTQAKPICSSCTLTASLSPTASP